MAVELRVIETNGSYGEILPDWSDLTFSQDLLQAGALTFRYPLSGRNVSYLKHGVVLAVLMDGLEPINGRFTYFEGEGSRILDADGLQSSYGCTSNITRFDKCRLAPAFGSVFADEDMFKWTDKTVGWMVNEAIINSRSRSNQFSANPSWYEHPLSFTSTSDSMGYSWPTTYDARFEPGRSVNEVIEWVTSNGFGEAYMDKRVLKLVQPERNGRDLSEGNNQVVLQTGRDFLEASYQTSSRDLITALLVMGENNSCVWVTDEAAIAKYGYREDILSISNASTKTTLEAAGRAYLATRNEPRNSYTYSVSALYLEQSGGTRRPFIDYQVGDSILILDGVETSVQRLRLLSATWPNSRAATINITVNDYFSEREEQFERRLNRLGL